MNSELWFFQIFAKVLRSNLSPYIYSLFIGTNVRILFDPLLDNLPLDVISR